VDKTYIRPGKDHEVEKYNYRYALHYSASPGAPRQWWEDGNDYQELVVLAYTDSDMAPNWYIEDRETGETEQVVSGYLPTEPIRRRYHQALYGY